MNRAAASVAAAFTLSLAACQRADSVLLIEVTSASELAPTSLQASVSADTGRWTASASGDLTLPAGLEVSLPADVVGPVTVTVDAFDGAGDRLAGGTTMQAHIDAGGETTVVVTLGEGDMEGPGP